MNILITPTNSYAAYAGALLTSIFENDKNTLFNVYILTTGFDKENTDKMEVLAQRYSQSIKIIQFSDEDSRVPVPGRWGISTYIKLFATDYIDADKVLYLDIDITVVGKLSLLENFDISEYYAAAPPDASTSEGHKKRLGIPQENFFGCCGVVYLNLKKWREDDLKQKSLSFIQDNFNIIQFADQDVINSVCTGRIYKLPMRFNMMAFFFRNAPLLSEEDKSDFVNELKHMVVIHYTCTKPWFSDCDMPLKNQFIKYADKSPWEISYPRSAHYTTIRYAINSIRYFIQRLNIKTYPYLFLSTRKVKKILKS